MNLHPPTSADVSRRPVAVTHSIEAPAVKVWAAISMPGNLEFGHPFCARNPVAVWPGEGSRDEVHYLSGWVYERRFVCWIDGVGYDLEIGGRGEAKSLVSWRIEAVDPATSKLTITVWPHVLRRIPAGLRWLAQLGYVRPMLRRYLSAVTQGFEWFVIRGEPVPRNQFGPHPWFSGRTRRAG